MKTFWFCDDCKQVGMVSFDEGVFGVVQILDRAHTLVSPECEAPVTKLRLLNFAAILTPHVPEWAVEPLMMAIQS